MRRRGLRLWPVVLVVVVVVVVVPAAYVLVQLLRPVPAMTMTPSPAPMRALPGAPPHPAWPGRAQAAVGMPGVGLLASRGGNQQVAIASVAKIMTAYVVLRGHPLPADGSGPAIIVSAADVAAYVRDDRQRQSVVKVAAGERLTERQAL